MVWVVTILCTNYLCAQKNKQFEAKTVTRHIGVNHLTNTPVKAIAHTFPKRIHHVAVDTVHKIAFLQLRDIRNKKWLNNKGAIVAFDLISHKILWQKKMNYLTESIQMYQGALIFRKPLKSYYLNLKTGEVVWKIRNALMFVDPSKNIGVGYQVRQEQLTQTVEGIDLRNGTVRWKRKMYRYYGWNDVFYDDNATMIVAAAGLHTFNLENGTGWDYETKTGEVGYKGGISLLTGLLGAAGGAISGFFILPSGAYDSGTATGVVSNIIREENFIYMASRDHLIKLDNKGVEKWSALFPKKMASASKIFTDDKNVYHINQGHAYWGEQPIHYGKPFIAAFDKTDGELQYLNKVSKTKKETIKGVSVNAHKDTLILLYHNRIARYRLKNGTIIDEKELITESKGGAHGFAGKQVFVKNNALFRGVSSQHNKYYVLLQNGELCVLNSMLGIEEIIKRDQLSILYTNKNNYRFLAQKDTTHVVDNSGKSIATFKADSQSIRINDKLYSWWGTNFTEVNLDTILNIGMKQE